LDDIEREETFQNYMDDLEKKEREEYKTATKQRCDNLRNLFEEQKLGLDTTWEQCQTQLATHAIFKAADNVERLSYIPCVTL
jgi:hypothetical protein